MHIDEIAFILVLITLGAGPFVVPAIAWWIFRHEGVWLYRIARYLRWVDGLVFFFFLAIDASFFLDEAWSLQTAFEKENFYKRLITQSVMVFIYWAPWGRIFRGRARLASSETS